MECLLEAVSETLQYIGVSVRNPYGLRIDRGRTYAVVGENGCGKTVLANILARGWNIGRNRILGDKQSLRVKVVEFSDVHSLSGSRDSYYQQRFEATMNDEVPTVDQLVEGRIPDELWNDLCDRLSLREIRRKRINYLSSGELRKFLVVNMMAGRPDLLILDNPYIGLDAPSRAVLDSLLGALAKEGMAVMLLLCNPKDIPAFTDYVVPMRKLELMPVQDVAVLGVEEVRRQAEELFPQRRVGDLPVTADKKEFETAFDLRDCTVRYEATVILRHVDWKVAKGECWALLGPNGSGKSTLLSMVCADNPQSYSNDIRIFDRKRGTGESIWDIKRHIGYISPEMHLYFREASDTLSVVVSGLHDYAGLYRKPGAEDCERARRWMEAFGIAELADCRFPALSSGEQRLVLLVRTLIKSPSLLILDEPLHGLDMSRKLQVQEAIERMVEESGATLVYVTHYMEEIPRCVSHIKRLEKIYNDN